LAPPTHGWSGPVAEELESAEDIVPFEPYKIYYLPTPYNAFGAGKVLMLRSIRSN